MYNEIYVNGDSVHIGESTQLLTAIEELKNLLDAGCDPVDVHIWWTDEDGRYHDITVLDGDWFHQHEIIKNVFDKIDLY